MKAVAIDRFGKEHLLTRQDSPSIAPMVLRTSDDLMSRWLELEPMSWRSDAESSMGSSPLIRARQAQPGSGRASWLASAESRIPTR